MAAYYNECDGKAATWLRNLIRLGLIAPGDVDDRSIADVQPSDLEAYSQVHLFAGLGGWSLAFRLAGWDDERPAWSGSCPCQPFSSAGRQGGTGDPRHLWPQFHRLIEACRPAVVFGEQVAVAAGARPRPSGKPSAKVRAGAAPAAEPSWLDGVSADLEGSGYTCWPSILPACAVNAPHRRDRLWFVADTEGGRDLRSDQPDGVFQLPLEPSQGGGVCTLADTDESLRRRGPDQSQRLEEGRAAAEGRGGAGDVADAGGAGPQDAQQPGEPGEAQRRLDARPAAAERGGAPVSGALEHAESLGRGEGVIQAELRSRRATRAVAGAWSDAVWITGADGKARRIGRRIRRVADGLPAGVGRRSSEGIAYEEGVDTHGNAPNTGNTEAVSELRGDDDPHAVPGRSTSGLHELQQHAILQSRLREYQDRSEERSASPASTEAAERSLRGVRRDGEPSRPPQGSRSSEQRPVEPDDVVWFLSSALALGEWEAAVETAVGVQALRRACATLGYVSETRAEIQEVWRSISGEARQRVGHLLCENGLIWELLPLLARNQPGRITMLKGFGNAIVPQVAAEIIGAYMDLD